jgi:glycosyltransferase involved in cell wall biosynthesis
METLQGKPPGVEVSVVLPVRNGGAYLADAVDSILNQSLRDLELLLVDDHSTDRAVERLERTDPRLKKMESPANGVVSAFNHGWAASSGRYIARMDADDISLPDRLRAQVNFLDRHPDVQIAGACVEIFSSSGVQEGYRLYQQWLNSVRTPDQVRRQIFIESPIANPTAMFRREALFQLDGYRDVDWPEDYDLFLRADQAGFAMAKPGEILLRWREHDKRLTHTDQRYSRLRFQQAKAHYLARTRLADLPLIILGAGPTGRQMYDLLQAEGREVAGFIDINPRRIGGLKRNKPVWGTQEPEQWPAGMILVAVGSRGAREEISSFLSTCNRQEGKDYLFVA